MVKCCCRCGTILSNIYLLLNWIEKTKRAGNGPFEPKYSVNAKKSTTNLILQIASSNWSIVKVLLTQKLFWDGKKCAYQRRAFSLIPRAWFMNEHTDSYCFQTFWLISLPTSNTYLHATIWQNNAWHSFSLLIRFTLKQNKSVKLIGQGPWSSGYGRRLMF